MASEEYGAVIDVSTTNAGSFLAADAAAAATVLTLVDVTLFEELVGQVYIDGTIYSYVSIDPTLFTMTLLTGLAAAADADTPVEIYPPKPVRSALVDFGVDEAEAVRVTIPYTFDLPDGVRPAENREVALIEERNPGELYLRDVIAKGMALLGAGEDLDDYIANGNFIQRSSADAAGGLNYPTPYAGVLEVLSTRPADLIMQRYTAYRNPSDGNYPSVWVRAFGAGAWSAWQAVHFGSTPVVANVAATSALTVTTSVQAIPGVTSTFTPSSLGAVYLVLGVVDVVGASGVGVVVTRLYVDSTAQTAEALYTAANGRATVAQQWIVSGMSVASHTLQLRAIGSGGGFTGYTIQNPHTTMKIIQLS